MQRRTFQAGLLAAGGLALAGPLHAQRSFQAGQDFRPLAKPAPVDAPAGRIEVVEFFWYGCPHCYHFEPALNAWVKALPSDVNFVKVPVKWPSNRVNFEGHQKLYYTLEALGKMPAAHTKVFEAGLGTPFFQMVKFPLPAAALTSSTETSAAVASAGTPLAFTLKS